jgi:hypothetical protein
MHASEEHHLVPDKIQLAGLVPALWSNYQDAIDWVIAISSAARMLCLMNPHKTKLNDFRGGEHGCQMIGPLLLVHMSER